LLLLAVLCGSLRSPRLCVEFVFVVFVPFCGEKFGSSLAAALLLQAIAPTYGQFHDAHKGLGYKPNFILLGALNS